MKKIYLLLTLAFFVGSTSASNEIPLEQFAKHAKFVNMQLSPTGKYIAFTYEENSETKLAVMERKTKKITAGFADGENRHIDYFEWLNDERLGMITQTRIGWLDGVNPEPVWLAANANGKKRKVLSKQRSSLNMISRLKDDPKHVLVLKRHFADQGKVKLHKLNIYTGKLTYISDTPESAKHTKPGIVGIGVDLEDNVRFAYEYDRGKDEIDDKDDRISLHYKNNQGFWERLRLSAVRANPNINLLGMSAKNDKFYFTSNHDQAESDSLGLFEFDFKSNKISLIYRHADADIGGTIYGKQDQVIGVTAQAGYPEVFYIDNEENKQEISFRKSVNSTFKGEYTSITSSTSDQSLYIINTWNDRNPGTFFLYDKKRGKITYQGDRITGLDSKQMARVEPFSFKARDGLKMYGYLTVPNNVEEKNLPMVVYPHGGPYGPRDNWRWDNRAQMLASRGYLVLQVNFRGSGGYGEDFAEAGHGEYGQNMIEDIIDATKWATSSGIADPERVCIHGVSYGGYATGMAVVREPDLFKCGIPDAGFYDIELQWLKADSFGSNNDAREWFFQRMMGADWKTDMKNHSSIDSMDKLKVPLLIVHGSEDVRVPIINAYKLEEKLKELNKPYEKIYKKEGHGFTKEENRVELYSKILEFLNKNIGP
ncbi:MAG: S9 family peptidase, partial [Kangiellaceae bacterium]|nr:S9 family peptidase [Kangiellaceae bacterium]